VGAGHHNRKKSANLCPHGQIAADPLPGSQTSPNILFVYRKKRACNFYCNSTSNISLRNSTTMGPDFVRFNKWPEIFSLSAHIEGLPAGRQDNASDN
jgi:hypothetical protein